MRKRRVTFCASITLTIVLGFGPLLTLAAPVDKMVSDSSRLLARASAPNGGASRSAKAAFNSKLLSKGPVQGVGAVPGQTSTLLPDGRILKTGGLEADGPVSTAVIDGSRNPLQRARAWHTATMLPNGSVLIVGGVGEHGQLVDSAEIFDPETLTSELLTSAVQSSTLNSRFPITPRVYHTATLLTDGLVLIAGGLTSKGDPIRETQLWDFRGGLATTLRSKLKTARYNHAATLLANGRVLLSGGLDKNGANLASDELYDPQSQSFTKTNPVADHDPQSSANPRLSASLPEHGATDVLLDGFIAFRFSKSLRVDTVNQETVALTGPHGRIETRVVSAEGGKLAFVTPKSPLSPGASYTASLAGSTDKDNLPLVSTSITFTTSTPRVPIEILDDEDWIPNSNDVGGDWETGRRNPQLESFPPLRAQAGDTALAGRVLTLNGRPLPRVTLKIDNRTAQTDETGRFLVDSLTPGHHELLIDGRSASRAGKTYGIFEAGVDITIGKTNDLSYTIWMPKLDTAHKVTIPSPTTSEVVVTTPRIPGLEVRIPAGAVIRDHDGKVVTEVSITAIPLDRTPFPLPGLKVPIYFTLQPGGAYVKVYGTGEHNGVRIIYPNRFDQPPQQPADFWHYDPEEKGWFIYGHGAVTADGSHITPDPGVAIYEFTGAMVYADSAAPAEGPPPGGGKSDGDPVDLATGLFVLEATDLALPDLIPIALSRTYRSRDATTRAFGIGANHPYNIFLAGDHVTYSYTDLILSDGARVHYVRTSPGNYFTDAEYESTATPTGFYKSRIKWNGSGWDLTLTDGTLYVFGDVAPLQYIRDRYGNKVLITHSNNQTGNITKITSSNGRWIEFTYDSSNRITQAKDNIARTVSYTYDVSGRLWKVTNTLAEVTEYTYDTSHRMLTIKDARGLVYLTNQYDANGRVTLQTQTDGTTYQFAYTLDGNGKVTQTDVTDPRGNVRRVTLNSKGYALSEMLAVDKPEAQAFTYDRQSGTNLLLSVTDPLNRRTDFSYDFMGNVLNITRLGGTAGAVTASFTYEPAFNQVATITDPLNHTTQVSYDSKGNPTSFADPLSNQTTFGYNSAGQATTATNALGKTAQCGYEAGDLVSITGPMAQAVNIFVDSGGRVLSVSDSVGQTTKFEYDLLNRPTRVIDLLMGANTFGYDPNGNLLSVTDGRNNVISYAYDNMDRVQSRTDPLLRASTYVYDNNGNLQQVTDRKSQVTSYTYDALNRLTLVTYADSSTTSYSYDGGNRLAQIVDSISGTITYTYDSLDRVTSEATPQGTVTYTYDAADRRTTMSVPGQATVSYSYDNADRLLQISQSASTVSLVYDAVSRVTTQALPNGVVTEFGFDDASRLASLTYKKSGNTLGSLTYAYDSAGRRTKIGGTLASTGLPQAVTSTTYNSANHQTGFGGQTLTYDNNGNLTSDGTNTYTWDARNQLLSLTGPGLSGSFQYDALGRRSGKTINAVTTGFLYDGLNVVQEQSGGSAIANLLTGGVDQLLQRTDSSGIAAPLSDANGSTVALTDLSGTIQTQYTYEPFGRSTTAGTANGNPAKFTGREDDGTGLYYYRARYYAPRSQRFISEDPIGLNGGTNFYEYGSGDPVDFTDPLGLKPQGKGFGDGPNGGYDNGGYLTAAAGGFPPHGHRPFWDKGGERWYEGGKGGGKPETGPRVTDPGGKPIDTGYDPYKNAKPGTEARNLQEEGRRIQRPQLDRYPQDGNWKTKARWWAAKTFDVVRRLGGAAGEFFKHGPGDVIIVLTPPEIIKDYIRGKVPRDIKSNNIRRGTSPDQDRGDAVSTEKASDRERDDVFRRHAARDGK